VSALAGFVQKEVRHVLRDRQTLAILLLLPLAQVLLFGYALRTDVREVRMVVVDPAPDHETLRLRARFAAGGVFRVVDVVASADSLPARFRRGDADQALVLAPGFARSLERPPGARVLLVTDATDPNTGSAMRAYAEAVIRDHQRELRGGAPGIALTPRVRMRFNPTMESVNLFIPGLIAVVLTVVSALMSAVSLSREKERGTLEVLLVSPLRSWEIIAGKVLPYLGLGFVNVLSVLAAARFVFGVPVRGSVLLLLAASLLFTVVSLALGVLIAARTRSQRTAMVGALMALMLPTILLSGMIFPIASMPGWLQPLSNLVPGKWFILIARGIMLKGVGLAQLWQETAVLAVMALALLAAAVRAFDVRLG
jgi:ABC-2 type transport system permease protein